MNRNYYRVLDVLRSEGDSIPAKRISRILGLKEVYVYKILRDLREEGLLEVDRSQYPLNHVVSKTGYKTRAIKRIEGLGLSAELEAKLRRCLT